MTCNCNNSRILNYTNCCNTCVTPAPEPSCLSHDTQYCSGICLNTTSDVVTTDTTFYLQFSNTCDNLIPVNSDEIYFYHASAGLIRVLSLEDEVYTVELVDDTQAGTTILTTDCVMVSVRPLFTVPVTQMCLSGNFTAPAVGATATIYIFNGAGIPIGATITFTYLNETGTYVVESFVSVTDDIYTYIVRNAGDGHVPGTLIIGDCDNACTVPITVVSVLDICTLDESQNLDTILGCVNGAARAMTAVGSGYIPVGTDEGKWEQQKITNVDCCVIISDCLKFTPGYTGNCDMVILQDVNLDCFEEAWAAAVAQDNNLPMIINDFQVIITDYDAMTHTVTVCPADASLVTELMTFDAGTQMCVGDCCASCNIGPQLTNHQLLAQPDPQDDAVVGITTVGGAIAAPAGVSYWLAGFQAPGLTGTVIELDGAYFAAPGTTGPILPKAGDPFIFDQKLVNTSPYGCDQWCKVHLNYNFYAHEITEDITIDFEMKHFAQPSATLEDGVTPNPNSIVSTQQFSAGRIVGPSVSDATLVTGSYGSGGNGSAKIYPWVAQDLRDFIYLREGDAIKSIVWFFFRVNNESIGEITFDISLGVRRQIIKEDWRLIPIPKNDPSLEDFKAP